MDRFVVVVERLLGLEHPHADVALVCECSREVNVLYVVQQVVFQCHPLATY